MLVTALRDFAYSEDGFTVRPACAGETVELPDALVPGLAATGYVEVLELEESEADASPPPRRGRPRKA